MYYVYNSRTMYKCRYGLYGAGNIHLLVSESQCPMETGLVVGLNGKAHIRFQLTYSPPASPNIIFAWKLHC
jgi:hypothetical protein